MTLNLKKYTKEWLFVPLGGTNEIGMNLNLYHYNDSWIAVDMGIGFADDYLPGIDVLLPDIEFFKQIQPKIAALILTHAHEDHIGALPYLWEDIQCPVYATPFTASIVRHKLADEGISPDRMDIRHMEAGKKLKLGEFSIDLIELTHSIPEMQAMAITTDKGTIIHTGDWKFDPDPVVGPVSDEDKLREYGDKGVLALVCDSTNIFTHGSSGSEASVKTALVEQINACNERVIVATFASNIARVQSIVEAATECGRKVALMGRSLKRVSKAAKETGYLKGVEFINEKDVMKYPRNQVLILSTGCQGEPRAAVSRMAQNAHPSVQLQKGDTVIFSAKIIPGNETRIRWLLNRLSDMGIAVVTEKDAPIHVSGHPARDELARMYALVRPKIAVPVHGEPMHIREHASFARAQGVVHTIESYNGSVVALGVEHDEEPWIIGGVQAGYQAVDGHSIIAIDSPVIKARRRLRDDGCITVSLVLDKDGVLLANPYITAPGSLDIVEDSDIIEEMCEIIAQDVDSTRGNISKFKEKARRNIKKYILRELGKKPLLDIHVHLV